MPTLPLISLAWDDGSSYLKFLSPISHQSLLEIILITDFGQKLHFVHSISITNHRDSQHCNYQVLTIFSPKCMQIMAMATTTTHPLPTQELITDINSLKNNYQKYQGFTWKKIN